MPARKNEDFMCLRYGMLVSLVLPVHYLPLVIFNWDIFSISGSISISPNLNIDKYSHPISWCRWPYFPPPSSCWWPSSFLSHLFGLSGSSLHNHRVVVYSFYPLERGEWMRAERLFSGCEAQNTWWNRRWRRWRLWSGQLKYSNLDCLITQIWIVCRPRLHKGVWYFIGLSYIQQ